MSHSIRTSHLHPDTLSSICPGRHFAESSLFMVVTSVLHTLTISAPIGADGKPDLPSGKMVVGLLAYVGVFSRRSLEMCL